MSPIVSGGNPAGFAGERGMTCDVYLSVTPDGGLMKGAPVLEPLEHLVLEKSPVSGFTEEATVLVPLEHSVPEKVLDVRPMVGLVARNPLEHLVFDVDKISLPMAPWDAGGCFALDIGRSWLYAGTYYVVLLSILEHWHGQVLLTCTLGYRLTQSE